MALHHPHNHTAEGAHQRHMIKRVSHSATNSAVRWLNEGDFSAFQPEQGEAEPSIFSSTNNFRCLLCSLRSAISFNGFHEVSPILLGFNRATTSAKSTVMVCFGTISQNCSLLKLFAFLLGLSQKLTNNWDQAWYSVSPIKIRHGTTVIRSPYNRLINRKSCYGTLGPLHF